MTIERAIERRDRIFFLLPNPDDRASSVLFFLFRTLGPVFGTTLLAVFHPSGV